MILNKWNDTTWRVLYLFFHKILNRYIVKFPKKIEWSVIREIFVYVGPAYVIIIISQHVGVALPSLACWYRLSLAGLSVSKSVLILNKTNRKSAMFRNKQKSKNCKLCNGFVSCDDSFASAFLNQGNICPVQNVSICQGSFGICIGKKIR